MPSDFEEPPDIPIVGITPIMRKYFKEKDRYEKAHRPVGGIGGPLKDAPGGGKIIDQSGSASTQHPVYFPWQILPVQTDSGVMLAVCSFSRLFHSPTPTDVFDVTGLGGAWPPVPDDASLFPVPDVGSFIRLEIDTATDGVFDPSTNTASIVSTPAQWTGYPDVIVINSDDPDNPFQISYVLPLGYITGADDTNPGILITLAPGSVVKLIQLFGGRGVGMRLGDQDGQPISCPDDPGPIILFNEA